MNEQLRAYYLDALGVQRWLPRQQAPDDEPSGDDFPVDSVAWQTLQAEVAQCRACQLCEGRTQTVFGVGSQQARLLIVGEAPGYHEDQQGEPFVGRAGQLLTAMLKAIGYQREQVYIANVLKCRPPNNRDPSPEEVAQCTPYLERQVRLLQPALILALGRHAAHYLLESHDALAKLRGRTHYFRDTDIPLIVSYHPAYLLRSPRDKRKAFTDLGKVTALLRDDAL